MADILKVAVLFLYVADIVGVIISIRLDKTKYFNVFKSLLMPLLLTSYLVFLPENLLNQTYQIFAITALILHFAGDFLLLFPKDKSKTCFYIGTLSFFVGHIFYSLWFAQPNWSHNKTALLIGIVVIAIAELLIAKSIFRGPKKLAIFLMGYTSGLALLFLAAISTLGSASSNAGSLIALAGIVLFWVSDYTIALRELKISGSKQMVTMTTYIAAQTLIVSGMYLMQV